MAQSDLHQHGCHAQQTVGDGIKSPTRLPIPPTFGGLSTATHTCIMSERASQESELLQLVSFIIAGEEYGVDILAVREIIRPVAITRVPHAPGFVEGVINLRGRIVPVIDLRRRFGLPERQRDRDARIVVVEIADKIVGFIVDAVREVIRVARNAIELPPELAVGVDARYITGITRLDDRLLILLELHEVLTADERTRLDPTARAAA